MSITMYKLAFCIPTYNFGAFIHDTLMNLIGQIDETVQIVIVDGGSTDNTLAEIERAKSVFPHIKLHVREQNMGVDRDILKSIELADAQVCWLFSSDDFLAAGSFAKLRPTFERDDWDVLLVGTMICDRHMESLRLHGYFDHPCPDRFDWRDAAARTRYFTKARTTTALFSFISSIIVRKATWDARPFPEEFVGSCWIIAAQLFSLATGQCTPHAPREDRPHAEREEYTGPGRFVVRYDPHVAVLKRGDNDSFMSRGIVRRFALSLEGFRRVGETYFGPASNEVAHIRRLLKREYPLRVLLVHQRLLVKAGNADDLQKWSALMDYHFGGGSLMDRLSRSILRIAPRWLCYLAGDLPCMADAILRQRWERLRGRAQG